MSAKQIVARVHDFALPWERKRSDKKAFNNWLALCFALLFVVGVPMPFLTLPEVEREELEELPPQLARIVLEKPKPKPPPPPPKKEVEEVKPEEPKPEEKPEEVKPKPEPKVADAKEKASVSGLLAFKDAFADMREAVDINKLQDTGAIQQGAGEAATIDRSLLTSKHSTRSAGVNVAALSRDTGGVALSGRETTKVDAPENIAGEGGVRKQRVADARSRSVEEIRRVFDTNFFGYYHPASAIVLCQENAWAFFSLTQETSKGWQLAPVMNCAVLVAGGIVFYLIGYRVFERRDIPAPL